MLYLNDKDSDNSFKWFGEKILKVDRVQHFPGRLNLEFNRAIGKHSIQAIMNGFEIPAFPARWADEKESLTLESLIKRVNKGFLESIFREIMETTQDYDIINIIKKI